jgi:hypothetical protein
VPEQEVVDPQPEGSPIETVLFWESVTRIALPNVLVDPGITAIAVMSAPTAQAGGLGETGLQSGVGGVVFEFVPTSSPAV